MDAGGSDPNMIHSHHVPVAESNPDDHRKVSDGGSSLLPSYPPQREPSHQPWMLKQAEESQAGTSRDSNVGNRAALSDSVQSQPLSRHAVKRSADGTDTSSHSADKKDASGEGEPYDAGPSKVEDESTLSDTEDPYYGQIETDVTTPVLLATCTAIGVGMYTIINTFGTAGDKGY